MYVCVPYQAALDIALVLAAALLLGALAVTGQVSLTRPLVQRLQELPARHINQPVAAATTDGGDEGTFRTVALVTGGSAGVDVCEGKERVTKK